MRPRASDYLRGGEKSRSLPATSQMLGATTIGSAVRMRTRYTPVFAVALVLGWSAPDFNQPHFGVSAEAKVKSRIIKKTKKHAVTVRKSAPRNAIAKPPIPPSRPVVLTRAPVATPPVPPPRPIMLARGPASSSPTPVLPVSPGSPMLISPPPDPRALTRDEQMEKLRIGLVRLATTILTSEHHTERLRAGLERLARAMNSGGIRDHFAAAK